MVMYLESLDGSQSYRADLFCKNHEGLVHGRVYTLEELGFQDWLKTTGARHKSPQRKLKAHWYGPTSNGTEGGRSDVVR